MELDEKKVKISQIYALIQRIRKNYTIVGHEEYISGSHRETVHCNGLGECAYSRYENGYDAEVEVSDYSERNILKPDRSNQELDEILVELSAKDIREISDIAEWIEKCEPCRFEPSIAGYIEDAGKRISERSRRQSLEKLKQELKAFVKGLTVNGRVL